jgi:hypothetical protein
METKSYRRKAQRPNCSNNGSSIIALYEQNIKKSATTKQQDTYPKDPSIIKYAKKK